MRVDCLLVSNDPQVQQTVATVFVGTNIRVRKDIRSALELIGKTHFDGFIIDCDGTENGTRLIPEVRRSRANGQAVIFTIVNGKTSVTLATELGSNFVLKKPIDAGRLKTYLVASLRKMEMEHRRYFRYQLTVDAQILRGDGKRIPAQILNVSDGGLALRLLTRAHLRGPVTVRFTTPGSRKIAVTATAAICWFSAPIFGMKFSEMDDESRSAYDEWLSSMALV